MTTGQVDITCDRRYREKDGVDKDRWEVEITTPSGTVHRRIVALEAGKDEIEWPMPEPSLRPDDQESALSWDRTVQEFESLSAAVTSRVAEAEQSKAYGRHLFDAFIGAEIWSQIRNEHESVNPMVVNLRWKDRSLHRFVWDLMHDGRGFLNLASDGPAVFLRVCDPEENAVTRKPMTIEGSPRVLFAVGASLGDARVRAGAEVMSIFRAIDRAKGGRPSAVRARVLTKASIEKLTKECTLRQPDVVHLIGHGQLTRQGAGGIWFLGDRGPGELVTGEQLADAVKNVKLVVLSVCEGGRNIAARPEDDDPEIHDEGEVDPTPGSPKVEVELPLAAELIANGVPIVVAMAGEISDTTCRTFTRSFVSSIAQGVPLVEAVATGRRAVYLFDLKDPGLVDWALPAVFTSAPVEEDFCLADVASTDELSNLIHLYEFSSQPLFAGRFELFTQLEGLLTDAGSKSSMIMRARTTKMGGTRALMELAAEAMRLGSVPVYLGPFSADDAPKTFGLLAWEIAKKIRAIAMREQVAAPLKTMSLLSELCLGDADASQRSELELVLQLQGGLESLGQVLDPSSVAEALTDDIYELRDRLAAKRPKVFSENARPVLLLDDVHRFGREGFEVFLRLLKSNGVSPTDRSLPVVLFGKQDEGDSASVLTSWSNSGNLPTDYHHTVELKSIDEIAREESRIAVLTWLLNPALSSGQAPSTVAVPSDLPGDEPMWLEMALLSMQDVFYSSRGFSKYVDAGIRKKVLTWGNDDAMLQAVEAGESR